MITVLFLRSGECHVSHFRRSNGTYRTVCAKSVAKNARANTLSTDNTFPGICQKCKAYVDAMFLTTLNSAPHYAKNQSTTYLTATMEMHRDNMKGPEADYSDIKERYWSKLQKYKKHIPKPSPKTKKKK